MSTKLTVKGSAFFQDPFVLSDLTQDGKPEYLASKNNFAGDQLSTFKLASGALLADVSFLKAQSEDRLQSLPVTGLPKEMESSGIEKIRTAVLKATWHLQKDHEGRYTHVQLRPPLNGGMKANIPFQDGLSLGSMVRGSVIAKMDKYSKKLSEIEAYEGQIKSANQRLKALESSDSNSSELQRKMIEKYKSNAEDKVKEIMARPCEDLPIFTSVQLALQSPIDMAKSSITVQPRGFDSLHFISKYINIHESHAEIEDKINQASSSGSASVSGGWGLFSANASTSWAKSATDRINQIKKGNRATGVLLINANLTSKNVKSFSSIKYNQSSLETLVDVIEKAPEGEKKEEYLDKYGLTLENGEPVLYLLTDSVMGGSFTALVTFLSEDEMNRRAELEASERSRTSSLGAGYLGVVGVSGSYSSSNAKQSESDLMNQLMSTRVDIEFISQGAIPGFARDVIEKEVMQHLSLNPAEFSPSKENSQHAKALVNSTGKELATLQTERRLRMEEAQLGVVNACRELASSKSSEKIHTAESVMGAYENFAKEMATGEHAGVPIGFNITRLTLSTIKKELQDLKNESRSNS